MGKKDEKKTKAQLIDELNLLRKRLASLDGPTSAAAGLGKDASPAKPDLSAQKELVRMRNLLRNVFNSFPSALICMNLDRKITHWNQKAVELFGIMKKDAIGLKIGEVFPKLDLVKPGLEKAIQSRQTCELRNVLIDEEPELRFGDVVIYPLFTDEIEGALISVNDATARIHTEEMLIQSEKMFSVGGLAAGMAQEINNPLAGIVQSIFVMQNRLIGDLEPNVAAASECGTLNNRHTGAGDLVQELKKSHEFGDHLGTLLFCVLPHIGPGREKLPLRLENQQMKIEILGELTQNIVDLLHHRLSHDV